MNVVESKLSALFFYRTPRLNYGPRSRPHLLLDRRLLAMDATLLEICPRKIDSLVADSESGIEAITPVWISMANELPLNFLFSIPKRHDLSHESRDTTRTW